MEIARTTVPSPAWSSRTPSVAGYERFTSRGLCFVLPLKPGQRVLVIGADEPLSRSLHLLGLQCVTLRAAVDRGVSRGRRSAMVVADSSKSLPFGRHAFDHVIVPEVARQDLSPLPSELVRVIRPSGTAYLGVSIAGSWRRRFPGLAVRDLKALVDRVGLRTSCVYGVRPGLSKPRYLVPLDSRNGLRWFTKLVRPPLAITRPAGLPVWVGTPSFSGLGMVLRRTPEAT